MAMCWAEQQELPIDNALRSMSARKTPQPLSDILTYIYLHVMSLELTTTFYTFITDIISLISLFSFAQCAVHTY